MTKTYRGALLLALVIPLILPSAAAAAVPAGVTKGLDYLHTRQRTDGGFAYSSSHGNTSDTPWVMLAIAAGGNNPARWQVDGLSPLTFLQDTNLAVSAANSGNAPEYYALCILAYKAANRTDLLTSAGSAQIDLVGKLESYQVLPGGYYSPATPATTAASTETTAWAVLGLVAAHQSGPSVSAAVSWLEANPNTTSAYGVGGFGSQPNSQSSTTITSLVMQALVAGQVATSDTVVQNAASFIESMRHSDGGFWDTAGGYSNAPSTAWAIEGLHTAIIDPSKLSPSPYTFLASLRQKNGSSYEFRGDLGDVMNATIQATIALSGKTLGTINHGPNVLTRFDPSFTTGTVAPKNGARFAGRTGRDQGGLPRQRKRHRSRPQGHRRDRRRQVEDQGGAHLRVASQPAAHQAEERHPHLRHHCARLGRQRRPRSAQLHDRRPDRRRQHRRRHASRWRHRQLGRRLRRRDRRAPFGYADPQGDDHPGTDRHPRSHPDAHSLELLPEFADQPVAERVGHGTGDRLRGLGRRRAHGGCGGHDPGGARAAGLRRIVARTPASAGRHGRRDEGRDPATRLIGLAAVLEILRRTAAGRREVSPACI